jgi:hypothetical protein
MRAARTKILLVAAVAVLAALACFEVGRLTARGAAPARTDRTADYFDGLRVGEAQGRQEGRVLQEGASLPAQARRRVAAAFDDGYAAGANDAFAGYDGGWTLGAPYIVTLEAGQGRIVYRIRDRTAMAPGLDYRVCAGSQVCSRRR